MKTLRFAAIFGSLAVVLAVSTNALADDSTVLTMKDGTLLHGFWSLPSGAPKGVAVILQGSGNVGADGDVSSPLLGNGYHGASAKLSEQLASTLSAAGVASLRYDKRGYNADPTQAFNPPVGLIIQDAVQAMQIAESRFPGLKTAFVGLSEGALVATVAASEHGVDSLFLLSLPTRGLDDLLSYQFVQWPVDLLTTKLDLNHDGFLSSNELAPLDASGLLPLLGPTLTGEVWTALDTRHDGGVSVTTELIPAYESALESVHSLMASSALAPWYNSFVELAPFKTYAGKITGHVYVYQGMEDAQVNWSWIVSDQRYFPSAPKLQLFQNLGHCFSPMDGAIGQIKTSGPLDESVLDDLASDVASFLLTPQ